MLRICFRQIPSGYYIQTMNSNLHLNNLLLPIGAMNVISILPLLLLAPLIEFVTTFYLSMEKTPLSPAKVISECFYVHTCTPSLMHTSFYCLHLNVPMSLLLFCLSHPPSLLPWLLCSPLSHHPSLSILPFQLWAMCVPLCRSWWQVCLSCRGRLTPWWSRLCLEKFCKCRPCRVSSWLLSTSYLVLQRLSSPLHVSDRLKATIISFDAGLQGSCWDAALCVTNTHDKSSAVTSSLAGSLISFQLTPSHIRGISLHFLTLSYGGGCFLGAFLIQLVYFPSGGKMHTNTV